jgi:transposase
MYVNMKNLDGIFTIFMKFVWIGNCTQVCTSYLYALEQATLEALKIIWIQIWLRQNDPLLTIKVSSW